MTDIRLESDAVYVQFRKVLRKTRTEILAKLTGIPSDLTARRRWLYRGLEQIDEMLKGKASVVGGKVVIRKPGLADVLRKEIPIKELYEGGLKDAQQRLQLGFPILNRNVMEYAANYQFEYLQNLRDVARMRTITAIRSGVLQGEGTERIARRITGSGMTRGVWPSIEVRARVFARTETARIVIGGRMDGYRELDVEVVRFEGRATNCKVCSALLGKEFPIEEAPDMPVHPNCVHDLVPVVRKGLRIG